MIESRQANGWRQAAKDGARYLGIALGAAIVVFAAASLAFVAARLAS